MSPLDLAIYQHLRTQTLAKLAPSDEAAYQAIRTEADARWRVGLAPDAWSAMAQVVAEKPALLEDYLRECGVTTTDVEKTHHEKETTMTADAELTILTKAYKAQNPTATDLETLNAVVKERPDLWARVRREGADVPLAKVVRKSAPPAHPAVLEFEKRVSDLERKGLSKRAAQDQVMATEDGALLYQAYRQDYGR
jgi:hypothetical protein